jgi:hypothetical protein
VAPSKWTKFFKVPDEEQLIMFLEDGPYANYLTHFCDWIPRGQKSSFVCLQSDCPLCEVDTATPRVRFNILDCSGDEPVLVTYECGITVAETLMRYNEDAKVGPLGGTYYAISMTGTKNRRQTQIRPVKVRDLEDDWHFEALTEDELHKFQAKLWDDSSIERSNRQELEEIASSVTQ